MEPKQDYADLVILGAAKMVADDKMTPIQRFSLAEAVKRASGLSCEETALSDKMLHTALLRAENDVVAEVDEDIRLALDDATAAPCCVRTAICEAVESNGDDDAITPTEIDMDEWHGALLDIAERKAGRDWELEPTLLEMTWHDRFETERRLGIPEGYFSTPIPGAGEIAAADRFLGHLTVPSRFQQ